MPRPPILSTINWKSVFESGVPFEEWLKEGESAENRAKMREAAGRLVLAAEVAAALRGLERDVNVVAIAEDWCGDVVRNVPVLEALVRVSGRVRVRYVSRAQHPDVFVRFLTNGGEAIPKFVFLSDGWVECGNWGPMHSAARRLIARGKGAGNVKAAREKVGAMYAADPNCGTDAAELLELIQTAVCTEP